MNETPVRHSRPSQRSLSKARKLTPETMAPLEAVIMRTNWIGSHKLLAEQALIECGYSCTSINDDTLNIGKVRSRSEPRSRDI